MKSQEKRGSRTISLLFVLSPCHSTPSSVALGVARGIPAVVCAPRGAVRFLLWCVTVLALALACVICPSLQSKMKPNKFLQGTCNIEWRWIPLHSRYNRDKQKNFGWQQLLWLLHLVPTDWFERSFIPDKSIEDALPTRKENRRFASLKGQGKHGSLSWNVKELIYDQFLGEW